MSLSRKQIISKTKKYHNSTPHCRPLRLTVWEIIFPDWWPVWKKRLPVWKNISGLVHQSGFFFDATRLFREIISTWGQKTGSAQIYFRTGSRLVPDCPDWCTHSEAFQFLLKIRSLVSGASKIAPLSVKTQIRRTCFLPWHLASGASEVAPLSIKTQFLYVIAGPVFCLDTWPREHQKLHTSQLKYICSCRQPLRTKIAAMSRLVVSLGT